MKLVRLIGFALAILAAVSAAQAVPNLISYQGVLMNSGGVAVPDGTYTLSFRLYTTSSGGSAVWGEINPSVQVSKGVFNAILGGIAPLPPAAFEMALYLGVSVEGQAELSPRTMLTSAPYALCAMSLSGATNVIPSDGYVGLGTNAPIERLDVNGGIRFGTTTGAHAGTLRWTGNDFEGYNGSAWTSLTATGTDLPPGSMGQTLRHTGAGWAASSNLYNDGTHIGIGTSNPEWRLDVDGDMRLGSGSANGMVALFSAGASSPEVLLKADGLSGLGGSIRFGKDNIGWPFGRIEPDVNGGGGYLNISGVTGQFAVDGNSHGSGEPRLYITGIGQSFEMGPSSTGDQSVMFPPDAISAVEMMDEPGVASYSYGPGTPLGSGGWTVVASQSITIPAAGYILVIATANPMLSHSIGLETRAIIGVSDNDAGLPDNQDNYLQLAAAMPSGTYFFPASVHGMFEEVSAGTYTFYMLGYAYSGSCTCYERQLSLVYIPTTYGTFDPMLAAGSSGDEKTIGPALTSGDIAIQKTSTEAANAARIERELAAMKERLAAVEQEIRNEKR